ncbi:MAG: hypothetical protein AAF609_24090 [Cyanobacteria bacterium P01_C01_bin.120]
MTIRRYARACMKLPCQIWAWSQHDPYQAIGVGTLVLFLALAAKLILAVAAGVAIAGGIYRLYQPGVD